jgi:hypothetical protein
MPLPCIRLVVTPLVEQRLRALALEENRSVSQMGAILLSQAIERVRDEKANRANVVKLTSLLRGEPAE